MMKRVGFSYTYVCLCVCVCVCVFMFMSLFGLETPLISCLLLLLLLLLLYLLQMALQPGVGLGLRYSMSPGLSVPCSFSPVLYTHLFQVHGHVIQPAHSWSSSSSRCLQLSVQHFFWGISVSCILSISPSHRILWHLINLFSP